MNSMYESSEASVSDGTPLTVVPNTARCQMWLYNVTVVVNILQTRKSKNLYKSS